jgi:hypothetical protein
MTDEGRPRPRLVDENPVDRRAESRRLRPVVDDAPPPERVEGSRRLNVLKPAEAPAPTTELPPAWLPPRAPPARPASRRLVADPAPSRAPVDDAAPVAAPSLLARLESRTGMSRRALFGSGALAATVLVAVGLAGLRPPAGSRTFDADDRVALAAAWRRAGPADWGGLQDDAGVVATTARVGAAVGVGFGGPAVEVIVVAEPASVHGFALPDGAVVLTTGLLRRLTSEAELAAIVAHLHAHHRLGHVAAGLDQPATLAARAAAILAGLDGAATNATGTDAAVLVAVASSAATQANAHALEPDADAAAAVALGAAGYDVSALRAVFQRITPPSALSTLHPGSPARVAGLAALPTGGRVDADRYHREVLAGLDRQRGAIARATAPSTPPPTAPTPTPGPIGEPPPPSTGPPTSTTMPPPAAKGPKRPKQPRRSPR